MTQTKAELLETKHQGDIRLGDANSSHYVGFKAPATVGTSLVWTLPAADGTAGYYLKTDGSGNLGWSIDNSGVSLSGSTNNTIATVTGANALQGENDLTFDGNTLTHTVAANDHRIQTIAAGNHYTQLRFDSNRSSAADTLSVIDFRWDGTTVVDIIAAAGADTTNKDDGILAFRTSASAGGIAERMRIDSSGRVGIGESSPSYQLDVKGDTGVYASAGSNGTAAQITLSGRNSGGSGSALSRLKSYPDGSSNQSHFAIETRNSSASMVEAMRITSNQKVLIGTDTEGSNAADNLTIADSGDCGLTIRSGTSSSGQIYFSDATSGDDEYDGAIEWSHSTQVMKFYADSGERFRIASSGQIGIGGGNYGTSGQVLTSGGSSSAPSWADAAGGGATPTVKTANYTASSGDMVVVNGTGLTITLPSSPSTGDSVAIRILGDRYATIARNSSNIESTASNFYVDIFDGYVTFTYSDSTRGWLIGG